MLFYSLHTRTACIDQDSANPAEQLNASMGRIIGSCDVMCVPVHDPHWREWSVGGHHNIKDAFTDYSAKAFKEYLGRGWCRLEMFFNANVPLKAGRAKLFGGELKKIMMEEQRRPHLLFGTREKELDKMPIILRQLADEEFEKFHPGKGELFDKRDQIVINAYVEELFKINIKLMV